MIVNSAMSEFALLRERTGLSIQQLADRIGFSARTVYRWDRGERPPRKVAIHYLDRLASDARLPAADDPPFRFIDLFAGIGGLRRGVERRRAKRRGWYCPLSVPQGWFFPIA